MESTRIGISIDDTMEQAGLEDESKSDLHALRQELEKSIATDTHLSLGITGNSLLNNEVVDVNGGAVISGIDREPAVVINSFGSPQHNDIEKNVQDGFNSQLPTEMEDAAHKNDSEVPSETADSVKQPAASLDSKQSVIAEGLLNPGELKEKGPESKDYHGDGDALKGRKVNKKFGRKYYSGEVMGFDPETNWYKVVYEDGDQEELWWWELEPILLESGTLPSRKRSRSGVGAEAEHKSAAKKVRKDQRSQLQEQHTGSDLPIAQVASDEKAVSESDAKKSGRSAKRGKKGKPDVNMNGKSLQVEGGSMSTESKLATLSGSEEPVDSANRKTLRTRKALEDKSNATKDLGPKLVGRKTRKEFGGTMYTGEVISYDSDAKYYKIYYEDGDQEELDWSELEPTLLPTDEQTPLPNRFSPSTKSTKSPGLSRFRLSVAIDEQKASSKRGGVRSGKKNAARLERKLQEFGTISPVSHTHSSAFHPALEAVRFASASDAESLEFYAWGEVVAFDKTKCPELQAARTLPTSSPIVHLAASHHHLAALTAAGQVFVWRNKHGNIRERCSQWEHISDLDTKAIVLVDIAGPDLDRSLAGYAPNQEDQVPDPFYLVAVTYDGKDYVLQGSQPQEPVHTYRLSDEPQHLSLEALLELNDAPVERMGRIVQVSVGTVEALDEPPFVGYITDTDRIYIRSATKDFMEEVNRVTGFSGRPIKIQCGRAYHAIMMTDDGRAWTWGRGYFPGVNTTSNTSKLPSPFSICQPALGTLVGRKVVDVGCYGEEFIALTEDGDIHLWTHGVPNPALGVYNVPATPVFNVASEDRLKKVAIGAGICAGISSIAKVHTWRTFPREGFVVEKAASTPFGRDEKSKDTTVTALGNRDVSKVICVAGSLIVVGHKRPRGRPGSKRKPESATADTAAGEQEVFDATEA